MSAELPDVLQKAREMLQNLTPLYTDCGKLCQGLCCRPIEGENTGMLLFPGEEDYYASLPGYTVRAVPAGMLLTCAGTCRRDDRPLSCRLFPLVPVLRADGVKVAVDLRAKPVCPLARQGKSGLAPEFVEGVRAVGRLLAEDPEQRAFLARLTSEQDDLRALKKQFGGMNRV